MKIGIDASRANRKFKTGVEWYSYNLIENLKKLDHDNQYLLYTNTALQGELAKCPANFKEKILAWPPIRLWTLVRLSYEMKKGKEIPELLFVPAHTIPLFNPAKVVVTVHDIGFARFPKYYHLVDKLYHEWTMKFIRKNATRIITVSEFSKQEIMDVYNIPEEKIFVTPISYNSDVYKRLEWTEEEKNKYLKEQFALTDPFFLFVGRLEKKKNIGGLVSAFLKFKEKNPESKHKLVLAGRQGLSFDAVEMELEMSQYGDEVIWIDYATQADLVKLMNAAAVFVFPSFYEGFGIPPLEAMACGCPVICSNAASIPEVVGDAAIKFNPHNVDAIVKAMETVVFNQEICEALVMAGYEQIRKYSWETCARQTRQIFESLA
jgi:glycosyltransferase involved in cell wall biosynthesis